MIYIRKRYFMDVSFFSMRNTTVRNILYPNSFIHLMKEQGYTLKRNVPHNIEVDIYKISLQYRQWSCWVKLSCYGVFT